MVALGGEPVLTECLLRRGLVIRLTRAIVSVLIDPDIQRQVGRECLPVQHGHRLERRPLRLQAAEDCVHALVEYLWNLIESICK